MQQTQASFGSGFLLAGVRASDYFPRLSRISNSASWWPSNEWQASRNLGQRAWSSRLLSSHRSQSDSSRLVGYTFWCAVVHWSAATPHNRKQSLAERDLEQVQKHSHSQLLFTSSETLQEYKEGPHYFITQYT